MVDLAPVRLSRPVGGGENSGPDLGGVGCAIQECHVLDDKGQAEIGPSVLEGSGDVAPVNLCRCCSRGIDEIQQSGVARDVGERNSALLDLVYAPGATRAEPGP